MEIMDKKKIKLIAFDLDHTVLRQNMFISDFTKETFNLCAKKGIKLLPVTGRSFLRMDFLIEGIEGIEHTVCSTGAVIYDNSTRKIIMKEYLSTEDAIESYEIADRYSVSQLIMINGSSFWEKKNPFPDRIICKTDEEKRIQDLILKEGIKKYILRKEYPVEKYAIQFDDKNKQKTCWEVLKKEVPTVTLTWGFTNNIEISSENATKSKALKKMADYYGIKMDEIIAFGDADNDVLMLKESGIGVCVENGCDEAKSVANIIAPPNEEDGPAKVLREILL